jgi:hypothetical protein
MTKEFTLGNERSAGQANVQAFSCKRITKMAQIKAQH